MENAKKIIEKLKLSDYIDVEENAVEIYKMIAEICGSEPSIDIHARIKRQISLVILNPDVFPEDIIDAFNIQLKEQLAIKRIHNNDITMQKLLEGTKYVSEDYNKSYKEASIFKEIDRITNKLF